MHKFMFNFHSLLDPINPDLFLFNVNSFNRIIVENIVFSSAGFELESYQQKASTLVTTASILKSFSRKSRKLSFWR